MAFVGVREWEEMRMRAVGEAFEEERLQPSRKEKGACFLKKHEACYLGFGAVFAA